MKVGDLATTHTGNLVVIVDIGKDRYGKTAWYDIVFSTTGFLRTGYPPMWLRKYKADKKCP